MGIGIATIVVVMVIVTIYFFLQKLSTINRESYDNLQRLSTQRDTMLNCNQTDISEEQNCLRYSTLQTSQTNVNLSDAVKIKVADIPTLSKREVERNRFAVGDKIGSGNFGTVHKGELKGLFDAHTTTTVAIKSINGKKLDEIEVENMISEIKIMSNLSPHLNIVSMIASCSSEFAENEKLWLLLEFCQHGDLKQYLEINKTEIISENSTSSINQRCLIQWAYDVASGMEFLASNQIMHGDLAARNILMDENPIQGRHPVAKVADFGLSKKFNDYLIYEKEARLLVPWRWMAIEYLNDNYFTLTSDVWSFGVLFWEIFSFGKTPYGHQGYDEVVEKLQTKYRLVCPKEIKEASSWSPEEIYIKISSACFIADPKVRSTFSEIVKILRNELSQEEFLCYTQMKDTYLSTRTANYLKRNRN